MRRFFRTLASLLALILLLSALSACGGPSGEAPPEQESQSGQPKSAPSPAPVNPDAPPPAGTLAIGFLAGAAESDAILEIGILEGLLRTDGSSYVPGVAERCETEDFTNWTFTLRKNAQWSDGTPVTAEDFVHSWQIAKENGFFDDIKPLEDMTFSADGPDKLSVKLTAACEWFPQYAASALLAPVHRALYERNPAEYGKTLDLTGCNGPYVLKEITSDGDVLLTKNEKYWNAESVSANTVLLRPFESEEAMAAAVETGMIHAAKAQTPAAKDVPAVSFQSAATLTLIMNRMRMDVNGEMLNEEISGTLSNDHLRNALTYAIDRTALTDISPSAWQPAGFLVPGMICSNENSVIADGQTSRDYEALRSATSNLMGLNLTADPDTARDFLNKFLSEMRYTDVSALPAIPLTAADDEGSKAVAQGIVRQIGETLKINLVPEFVSADELKRRAEAGEYDLILYPVEAAYNDPMSMLALFGEQDFFNCAWHFVDTQGSAYFKTLLSFVSGGGFVEKRSEYLAQAENIAMISSPILPICYMSQSILTDGTYDGLRLTWDGRLDYTRAVAAK